MSALSIPEELRGRICLANNAQRSNLLGQQLHLSDVAMNAFCQNFIEEASRVLALQTKAEDDNAS